MNRRLPLVLAIIALLAGWGALGFMVFGPAYSTAGTGVDSTGVTTHSTGTASLLQVGLSPMTIFFLGLFAAAYLAVVIGAWLVVRRRRGARWLMLAAVMPLLALNAISFGLLLAVPATVLATIATATAFARGESAE